MVNAREQKTEQVQNATKFPFEASKQIVMDWHIINHRDYIDGPFATFDDAQREAFVLGEETRSMPRITRKARDFYIYKPPYDRKERWQPEYWICTKEAALSQGVAEALFTHSTQAA